MTDDRSVVQISRACWQSCQDAYVVQVLKEAQVQSNITSSSASVTPTRVSGADDMECPTWMHYSNETNSCLCGADYHGVVKYNAILNETYFSYQMTYDDKFQHVIAGLSFYGYTNQAKLYSIYRRVPANRSQINEEMCNQFYRSGRLCGECRYSLSLNCIDCNPVSICQGCVHICTETNSIIMP